VPETDARIVIDRLLREAGWDPEDKSQVATEEATGDGRADYLLLDQRGRPVAVVEAKRFTVDPYSAKHRTLDYATALEAPFIFLSNGETHYFWNHAEADARQVEGFFTRHDLERLAALKLHRRPISSVPIPDTYVKQGEERTVRPYQKDALRAIDRALEGGRRKILIEMATGTGKTDVIALAMKRMFQAGLVERVLFLVDRIELAKQAKYDTFDEVLSDYPSVVLFGGRRSREGQIVVGTLDTIRSQLGPAGFSSGYFDLVITDECHRSIYGQHRYILTHFDAIQIGLTATPSVGQYAWVNETERQLVRNTYLFFQCWNAAEERGEPTFSYGILEGIRDRYLADYDIYLAQTRITLEGVEWDDVRYGTSDLERIVTSEDRNALMVSEFVEVEKKRDGHPRKTIVFAMTKNHAAQLTRFLNRHYPEFQGRYAEQITCDIPGVDRLIRRFKRELLPVVAVSVGMLDTGFDCPEIENLVMMRPTKSAILYQQMRGRGNRLCKTTRWGTELNKTSFLIYDFAGNVIRFNDPKFDPTKPLEPQPPRPPRPPGPEPPQPPQAPREFVTIPEGSVEDRFVERRIIEVGPEGLRVDARTYWDNFVDRASEMADDHPAVRRVKQGEIDVSDDELVDLEERLNTPEFYFNERNLRNATEQPFATLLDFLKAAFGLLRFPNREERIGQAFDAWIIDRNFDPDQARLLRMLKNQVVAGRVPDLGAFNQPPLRDHGGLGLAIKLFGEQSLKQVMDELSSGVFL